MLLQKKPPLERWHNAVAKIPPHKILKNQDRKVDAFVGDKLLGAAFGRWIYRQNTCMDANRCRYNEGEATILAGTVLSNKFMADRYLLLLLPRHPEYQDWSTVIQTSQKRTKAREHALATVVEAAALHVHDARAVDDLLEWLINEAAGSKQKSERLLVKEAATRAQQQKKKEKKRTKKKKEKGEKKPRMKPFFEWLAGKIHMVKPDAGNLQELSVDKNLQSESATPTKLPPLTEEGSLQQLIQLGGLVRVSQRGPKHAPKFHTEAHLGSVSAHVMGTSKKKAKRSAAIRCLEKKAKRSAAIKCLLEETTDIDRVQKPVHYKNRELRGCVKKVMAMGGIVQVQQKGPDHAPVFHANADLGDISVSATAFTKKLAKCTAAWKCLQELKLRSA